MDLLFASGKLFAASYLLLGCSLHDSSLEVAIASIAGYVASGFYGLGLLDILSPLSLQLCELASAISISVSVYRLLLMETSSSIYGYLATGTVLAGTVAILQPFMFNLSSSPYFRRPVMARVAAELMASYVLGLLATNGTGYAVVIQSIGWLLCITSTSSLLMVGISPEVTAYGLSATRFVLVASIVSFSSIFVLADKERAPISENYPLFSAIAMAFMMSSIQLKLE